MNSLISGFFFYLPQIHWKSATVTRGGLGRGHQHYSQHLKITQVLGRWVLLVNCRSNQICGQEKFSLQVRIAKQPVAQIGLGLLFAFLCIAIHISLPRIF